MSNSDQSASIRRRAAVPKDQCPMALAAEILGDRWTLLILREAFYGVKRYDDMRQDTGAPRSMLTDRLGRLVDAGILERRPYQEAGDRVRQAYVLTEMGRGLAHTMTAMSHWGARFVTGRPAPAQVVARGTGAPVEVAFVTGDGAVIDPRATVLHVQPVQDPAT